jgi:hypothetical protein
MNIILKYLKKIPIAFWIAFVYVGFGSVSVCSLYPDDLLYGDWAIWGYLFTFPISIVSFIFRYANASILYPVFIIQLVMLIIVFVFLYKKMGR